MPKKLKAYVALIITLGFLFVAFTFDQAGDINILSLTIFIALAITAESLLIPTPGERALSVGFAVGLTAILVFGVPEAIWISSLGVMLRVFKLNGKLHSPFNTPLYKILFNGSNIIISSGMAGICYKALGGVPGIIDFNNTLLPMLFSMLVYIFINATIISMLMSLLSGDTFINVWYKNIIWVVKDYFGMAPLGIIMAMAYINYGIVGLLLFFGPLLLARYSFKLYVDMKKMYLNTVRSLCNALEAKDPYTQGHSMRVSQYACELAERLGLSQKRIENLKIAAILHDVGKIGVSENILNKPGRLTDDEFKVIKLHPTIGYKITQEIEVLKEASEIILNHHERYDGLGYPNGKMANEIGIEASILSVVDAYDALVSDRPYRKAMTKEEALAIIERDKGTHFNPKVAEEFICMIRSKELNTLAG